jgi:hypothetical protein
VKALDEELGAVRLAELTASDVHKALAAMAARLSTRTLQIAYNVLVRMAEGAVADIRAVADLGAGNLVSVEGLSLSGCHSVNSRNVSRACRAVLRACSAVRRYSSRRSGQLAASSS